MKYPSALLVFYRGFLIGQKDQRSWKFVQFSSSKDSTAPVYKPHSHAFIDLTDDGSADLFVTATDGNNAAPRYEVWKVLISLLMLP